MDRDDIKQILPHREPMLLLDEVTVDADGRARGSYTVRGDEWFLQGHFPGHPVVPGVILCEMMAQACCALLADRVQGRTPLLTGLDGIRFKSTVGAGDRLDIFCGIDRMRDPFYFAQGKGYVGGKLCVGGAFSFAFVKGA